MEPVLVAPKFESSSLHIFSQASQNITAEVRVDRSVRRNNFIVKNPLHAKKKKKKKTMSMLFSQL
jgi:hypothetical protein